MFGESISYIYGSGLNGIVKNENSDNKSKFNNESKAAKKPCAIAGQRILKPKSVATKLKKLILFKNPFKDVFTRTRIIRPANKTFLALFIAASVVLRIF